MTTSPTSGIFELPLEQTVTPLPSGCRLFIGVPTDDTQSPQGSLKWIDVTTLFKDATMRNLTVTFGLTVQAGSSIVFADPSIYMTGLPTSAPAESGRLWNNAGTIKIVP